MTRWRSLAVGLALALSSAARAQDAAPEATTAIEVTPAVATSPAVETPTTPDDDPGSLDALLRESVVRTASRVSERPSEVPSTVATFTGDELLASGMRDLGEALAFLGSGLVVSSGRGFYYAQTDVGARGVVMRDFGRHVLVLVDGHIMNTPSAGGLGVQWLEVPLERIDHVEVALGPGSVLYGSSAMIAVIHVYTRAPSERLRTSAIGEVVVSAPNELDHDVALPGGSSRAGFAYRTGASFSAPVSLRSVDGSIAAHVEWQQSIGESVEYAARADVLSSRALDGSPWGGVASHEGRALRGVVAARLGDTTLRVFGATDWTNDPLTGVFDSPDSIWRFRIGRIDLRNDAIPSERLELTSRVFFDAHRIRRDTAVNTPAFCPPYDPSTYVPCELRVRLDATSVGVEEIASIDWDLDGRTLTTVGVTGVARMLALDVGSLYDLATHAPVAGGPTPTIEQTTLTGAIYVEQIVRPTQWFRLNVGGRLDADDQFGFHFSPRAALIARPTRRATIRLSYSEAFRAPSYQERVERHYNTQIPALSLRPELVRDVELEWSQSHDHVATSVVAFATGYRDMIALRGVTDDELADSVARGWVAPSTPVALVRVLDNVASVSSYGAVGRVRLDPTRDVSIVASGTASYARTSSGASSSTRLRMAPAFVGNLRLSYRVTGAGTTLSLASAFMSSRSAWTVTGAVTRHIPFTIDVRATASGPIGSGSGLHYRVSLGYAHPAAAPYSIGGPSASGPTDPAQLVATSGLHLLVGLRYEFEAAAAEP